MSYGAMSEEAEKALIRAQLWFEPDWMQDLSLKDLGDMGYELSKAAVGSVNPAQQRENNFVAKYDQQYQDIARKAFQNGIKIGLSENVEDLIAENLKAGRKIFQLPQRSLSPSQMPSATQAPQATARQVAPLAAAAGAAAVAGAAQQVVRDAWADQSVMGPEIESPLQQPDDIAPVKLHVLSYHSLQKSGDQAKVGYVNQDAFFQEPIASGGYIIIVADGHGDKDMHRGNFVSGEVPAQYVCENFPKLFVDYKRQGLTTVGAIQSAVRYMQGWFESQVGYAEVGTTFAAVICDELGYIYSVTVGDSRVMVIRDGIVVGQTQDHDYENVAERQRVGVVYVAEDERDREIVGNFDALHKVSIKRPGFGSSALSMTRSLGDTYLHGKGLLSAQPEIHQMKVKSGDIIVVVSDGAISTPWTPDYAEQARPIWQNEGKFAKYIVQRIKNKNVAEELCRYVDPRRGSKDDITAVIVQVEDDAKAGARRVKKSAQQKELRESAIRESGIMLRPLAAAAAAELPEHDNGEMLRSFLVAPTMVDEIRMLQDELGKYSHQEDQYKRQAMKRLYALLTLQEIQQADDARRQAGYLAFMAMTEDQRNQWRQERQQIEAAYRAELEQRMAWLQAPKRVLSEEEREKLDAYNRLLRWQAPLFSDLKTNQGLRESFEKCFARAWQEKTTHRWDSKQFEERFNQLFKEDPFSGGIIRKKLEEAIKAEEQRKQAQQAAPAAVAPAVAQPSQADIVRQQMDAAVARALEKRKSIEGQENVAREDEFGEFQSAAPVSQAPAVQRVFVQPVTPVPGWNPFDTQEGTYGGGLGALAAGQLLPAEKLAHEERLRAAAVQVQPSAVAALPVQPAGQLGASSVRRQGGYGRVALPVAPIAAVPVAPSKKTELALIRELMDLNRQLGVVSDKTAAAPQQAATQLPAPAAVFPAVPAPQSVMPVPVQQLTPEQRIDNFIYGLRQAGWRLPDNPVDAKIYMNIAMQMENQGQLPHGQTAEIKAQELLRQFSTMYEAFLALMKEQYGFDRNYWNNEELARIAILEAIKQEISGHLQASGLKREAYAARLLNDYIADRKQKWEQAQPAAAPIAQVAVPAVQAPQPVMPVPVQQLTPEQRYSNLYQPFIADIQRSGFNRGAGNNEVLAQEALTAAVITPGMGIRSDQEVMVLAKQMLHQKIAYRDQEMMLDQQRKQAAAQEAAARQAELRNQADQKRILKLKDRLGEKLASQPVRPAAQAPVANPWAANPAAAYQWQAVAPVPQPAAAPSLADLEKETERERREVDRMTKENEKERAELEARQAKVQGKKRAIEGQIKEAVQAFRLEYPKFIDFTDDEIMEVIKIVKQQVAAGTIKLNQVNAKVAQNLTERRQLTGAKFVKSAWDM